MCRRCDANHAKVSIQENPFEKFELHPLQVSSYFFSLAHVRAPTVSRVLRRDVGAPDHVVPRQWLAETHISVRDGAFHLQRRVWLAGVHWLPRGSLQPGGEPDRLQRFGMPLLPTGQVPARSRPELLLHNGGHVPARDIQRARKGTRTWQAGVGATAAAAESRAACTRRLRSVPGR